MSADKKTTKKSEYGAVSRFLDYVTQNHLWVFALMVIPVSLIYDFMWFVRLRLSYLFATGQKNHEERVADIQRQVR